MDIQVPFLEQTPYIFFVWAVYSSFYTYKLTLMTLFIYIASINMWGRFNYQNYHTRKCVHTLRDTVFMFLNYGFTIDNISQAVANIAPIANEAMWQTLNPAFT